MKNFLLVSNITEKLFGQAKRKSFIIINDDSRNGLYVEKLIDKIAEYKLKQQTAQFRQKTVKQSEPLDLIVFGDASKFESFDYRVDTDNTGNSINLEGSIPVYSLVKDWKKILKAVTTYAKTNNVAKISNYSNNTDSFVRININSNIPFVAPALEVVPRPINVCTPINSNDLITIHTFFVKIGYETYDIYANLCGEEFIYVGNKKYYIGEDRFGSKYLHK